jgi:putative ABC transport system permease protein
MTIGRTFRLAVRALRRNKMRSLLTMLGIIIGVGAVIAMVGIGNGARAQVEAQVASLGQNMISVFPGSFSSGGARGGWGSASTLTVEETKQIGREVPGVVAVSAEVRDRQQVMGNGLNWNTQVLGESPDYLGIRAWELESGAMFAEPDIAGATKVVVIGKTVADQLFPNMDPIGETLRIRNLPFKIIGVLKSKGVSFFGTDQDDVAVVPYTSAMRRITGRQYLSTILIQAESADQMSAVQDGVTNLLRQRRSGREPDFTVRNQLELAQTATATSKTMTMLLGAIAGVSLIVGGIGIMNIMLVSVTERTREIGIRMAVGAHGRDILMQFLIEAVTLSALSGLLGIGVGFGASKIISNVAGWATQIPMVSVILAFGVSALIGVGFGLYPAWKAAALDPIDALRYE